MILKIFWDVDLGPRYLQLIHEKTRAQKCQASFLHQYGSEQLSYGSLKGFLSQYISAQGVISMQYGSAHGYEKGLASSTRNQGILGLVGLS